MWSKLHYSFAKLEKLFERDNKNGVKSFAINAFSLLSAQNNYRLLPQNDIDERDVAKLKMT